MKLPIRRFSIWVASSYLGAALSMSMFAVLYWQTIGTPQAIRSVVLNSSFASGVVADAYVRSNLELIESGTIDEPTLRQAVSESFPEAKVIDASTEFAQQLHGWLDKNSDSGPFVFSYDFSQEVKKLEYLKPDVKSDFLPDSQLEISADPARSSLKIDAQRLNRLGKIISIVGPILFVVLFGTLFMLERSHLLALYRTKQVLFFGAFSLILSLPLQLIMWSYVSSRLSSYPKISLLGAVSLKPLSNELLGRLSAVVLCSAVVYTIVAFLISRYLKNKSFEKPSKGKNIMLEKSMWLTKAYLKKLR